MRYCDRRNKRQMGVEAMQSGKQVVSVQRSFGDAAVDGLFGGVGAGVLMVLYLVVAQVVAGDGPATTLSRFDTSGTASPWMGTLVHLAVAAVYGALFGLGVQFIVRIMRRPVPLWPAGLAYGLVLLLVAEAIVLPATGSALRGIPLVHFALAHVIFGVVLGLLIARAHR